MIEIVVPPMLILVILLALIFDYLNGFHDASNIVATMIASRAMGPRMALGMTALAEFTGPFLFGVAVASTIGKDIVAAEVINLEILLAALLSAIIWNLITWFLGIPSSSSHALIGGLVGAASIGAGLGHIQLVGLEKVLISLFLSPLLGLLIGFIFTRLVFHISKGASPRVNMVFKRSQILTALMLGFSHGTNDAQKTMGIITLALLTAGLMSEFYVPSWVVFASAGAIAGGTLSGGWRLIRTLGGKFYKIQPVHGFSSQVSSTAIILGASLLGGPVSTTQVVSATIMGVGAAERVKKVRWGVVGDIASAWLLTIPATAVAAALIYTLIFRFLINMAGFLVSTAG